MPETPLKPLEELFRANIIHLLVAEKLLPPERVQVLYSWKHSGFNLHAGERVPPEHKADLEDLAQYILRNPFSVEKMTMEQPGDIVIYRSVIEDPRVVEKILRHLGAWHDPPPRPPPQGLPGPYTYEPCDDVDPAPDYENVLID